MKKLDYEIVDNKFYFYTEEEKEDLKLRRLGGGTEADIYVFNNQYLIKIYKEELLEDKSEIYNEDRILEIASLREKIKKTNLLYGPMYINGEFKGCITHNHRYACNLHYMGLIPSTNYKIDRFTEINEALFELEKKGIYHIDIIPENVLLSKFKTAHIIDVDGKSVRLREDRNGYYSKKMYGNLFDMILDKLFDYKIDENEVSDFYIDEAFSLYDIKNSFKEELYDEKFSYELMKEFLEYLKQDEVLKKKLTM